jgi:hypothetical protein
MRLSSKILMIAVLAAVAASGACGGASDSPPAPLGNHFDDMYIARISPADKPDVQRTEQEWSLARAENAKAQADLDELNSTQMQVVRNDQKAAHLQVDSAVTSKKSAEASADTNRINQATKDMHNAEVVAKAADARVKYVEAYGEYLKRNVRYTQEVMYWRESQYEVAKAQTGQKNGIAPKGVAFDSFPKQEQDRSKRAASAKDRLESERQRAMTVRNTWRTAQDTADRDTGRPGNFPDPLAKTTTAGSSH